MSTSTIALIILACCIVLWVTELIPLVITAVMGATAMIATGVLTLAQGYGPFASETVWVVLGMTTVGNAMFETGAAQKIGNVIIKFAGDNERRLVMISSFAAGVISAFMANTGTTALFIAIFGGLIAANPKLNLKNLLLPVGITTCVGGACTLVGSTPQLVARGIMVDMLGQDIGFFTQTPVGAILLIACVAYFTSFGYTWCKKIWGDKSEEEIQAAQSANVQSEETKAEVNMTKIYTIIIIFALAVAGFITGAFNSIGIVAMIAGLCAIVTKCISSKRCFEMMDWNTVGVLGGALGIAAGLDVSGAGKMIALNFINMVGTEASAFTIFAMIMLIAVILTQFMSNTALVAMILPVVLFITMDMGLNSYSFAMGIIFAANMSFSTPLATPTVTMSMVAGYSFMDIVKYALPLNVVAYFLVILFVPLFFPLTL